MKKIINRLANYKYLLFLIVLFGFLIRFYSLGTVPGGFHADEAAFGYNAYSLLHTGKDEYGKILPLVLKSFGDYKGALYSYIDIPFVAIFGLTPFAVRFPSALFDSFTILLIYFFTLKFLGNRKIALISAFLYAISPWNIGIARTTGDVVIAVFFAFLMIYALCRLLDNNDKYWFSVSIISAVLSVLSYAAFRFYVVIIPIIFLIISIRKMQSSVKFNKAVLSVALILVGFGLLYSLVASTARFGQVSIFSNPQTDLILQEQLREDQFNPVIITRIFHNKVVNYTRTILKNTNEYFTFDYLFLNGGYPQRERIPNTGLFYIWEAFFLLVGIYVIVRRKKRNELFLILWWLILLLPTVITFDEIPNVHRNLITSPAIIIIIAIGIYEIFNYKVLKKIKVLPVIFIVLLIVGLYEFLYFEHQYFIHQNVHQPWYRGYAYKELVNDLNRYYPKYKKIVITKSNSSPYIYILFYSKYDPRKYQAEGSPRDLDYTGFDKYYFVPLDCPLNGGKNGTDEVHGEPGILYVDLGSCVTPLRNTKVLKIINWEDNTPAFKLMEYVATSPTELNLKF